jgi:hypothetical protein
MDPQLTPTAEAMESDLLLMQLDVCSKHDSSKWGDWLSSRPRRIQLFTNVCESCSVALKKG